MNELFIFYIVWFFVLGLCIGSFLNVVVLRGLSGESIVFPSSKCPKCGNKLKWWMNIPVLSYIFLKGKCGFCKTGISIQYPIVETFTGVLFSLIFLKFGFSFETLFFLMATSSLIVMSVCDFKESVIIDHHAYFLVLSGVIYNVVTGGMSGLLLAVLGGITGFVIYEILARLGYIVAEQRAFGEGDSLIAAGIGAFFGWKMMIASTFLSVLVMAIFSFPSFFIHSYKTGKKGTCRALIVALLLILVTVLVGKSNLSESFFAMTAFLVFACAVLVWIIKQIFADKKNDDGTSSFYAMPYGPAMAVSFLLIMFYAKEITAIIKPYFGILAD